jgi:ubiquinone/menaquinone biosynthesis C-methylase UbiE
MANRYTDEWVTTLLDAESRVGTSSPLDLLTGAGITQGMTVLDLGCGPGFLSYPAAQIVGAEGHIYAVDIESKMVDLVRAEAADRGLSNITTLRTNGDRVALTDNVADFAICALVLHYKDDDDARAAVLRDIARLLKPNGKLLLIDRPLGYQHLSELLQETGFTFGPEQPMLLKAYSVLANSPAAESH